MTDQIHTDKLPRYIVIAHSEVDRITAKLSLHKAFGEYTDDFEHCIEPTICAPDKLYVFDREAVEELRHVTGEALDDLFASGALDRHFQVDEQPIVLR